jgi:hypothetical protein
MKRTIHQEQLSLPDLRRRHDFPTVGDGFVDHSRGKVVKRVRDLLGSSFPHWGGPVGEVGVPPTAVAHFGEAIDLLCVIGAGMERFGSFCKSSRESRLWVSHEER